MPVLSAITAALRQNMTNTNVLDCVSSALQRLTADGRRSQVACRARGLTVECSRVVPCCCDCECGTASNAQSIVDESGLLPALAAVLQTRHEALSSTTAGSIIAVFANLADEGTLT